MFSYVYTYTQQRFKQLITINFVFKRYKEV